MALVRTLLAVVAAALALLLVVPVLVLSLPFWMAAWLTRTFCRLSERKAVPWPQIVEFNSTLGWKPKGNLDTYCRFPAGVFHVKTDVHGWRGKASFEESRVVVIGDSYAFGFGVDDQHAFFSLLDSQLPVKAIGSPGYNMVQELLWMKQLQSQLKDKLVLWLICLGNDLYDNLWPNMQQYRTPFVSEIQGTGEWDIVTSHLSTQPWPFSFEHNFRAEEKYRGAFGTNFLSQRTYSACDFLIRNGRDLCTQAGAQLVVMTVPWTIQLDRREWERTSRRFGNEKLFNFSLPDQRLGEICNRLGVRFLAGQESFNIHDHIPREGHWNERGHQRLAQLLLELSRDHRLGNRARVVTELALQAS